MKLRLRSLESKETIKLDIPDHSSLHLLKQTLAARSEPRSSSSSLPLSPNSIHLSLNRRDELGSSVPGDGDSLQALGVTSGDLIYFSLNPNAFSSPPQHQMVVPALAPSSPAQEPQIPLESEVGNTHHGDLDSMAIDNSAEGENLGQMSVDLDMKDVADEGEKYEQLDVSSELQDAESGSEVVEFDVYKHSVPDFLRRVLREELGNGEVEHRLVVVAVHAVMLESGFVGFNPVTRARFDSFHLPDKWPPAAFSISLSYTLPELLADGSSEVESVVLKFQSIGHYLTVYGSLAKGKSGLHRICLDEYRFAPTIDVMWANCDKKDGGNYGDSSTSSYPDNEVFEFWKVVKDGLALPLLIDICERANLPLPSCLMCLPAELKIQILELLNAEDLLKVACVSSELRYLSSHNDVWKQKFLSEFKDHKEMQGVSNWKQLYMIHMKKRELRRKSGIPGRRFRLVYVPMGQRDPDPLTLRAPRIIGGDHDWLPGLGPPSFGRLGAFPRIHHIRRNIGPSCNLGGLNH